MELSSRTWLLLFTILCSASSTQTAFDRHQTKKLMVRTLGQCKSQRNLPMVFYGFEYKHDEANSRMLLSIKVKLTQEISKNLLIVFNFWKCDPAGNLDTCEFVVKDKNVTNICKYMAQRNQPWAPFLEHFDKPVTCPIAPGIYKTEGIPVNTDFLNFIPIGDAMWRIQMDGYDQGKLISCVMFILQIVPYLRGS